MKKLALLVCFSGILVFTTKAQKSDFSGVWKLNKEKSDFGNSSPNSAPVQIIIKQTKEEISIERKQFFANGDSTQYVEKLNFKGEPVETKIKDDLTKTVRLKWSEDKTALMEEAKYSNNMDTKGKWSLSKDGKELILDRQFAVGEQSDHTSYVYNKG
jgi:hypothetical protein